MPSSRSLHTGLAVLLVLAAVAQVPLSVAGVASHGEPTDRAVRTGSTTPVENLTVSRGDAALYESLDGVESVRRARQTPELASPEPLVLGQTLVVGFRSPALNRTVAATNGTDSTDRFFRALNATNASVSVTSERGPECPPARIDLSESRTRVLRNASEGRFELLVDTGRLQVRGGCEVPSRVEGLYEVTITDPDGETSARAPLPVRAPDPEPPSAEGEVRIHRGAPAVVGHLSNATAVRRAQADRRLVPGEQAVQGETVVLTFRSAALNRSYERTAGANATARLLRALNATNGSLRVTSGRDELDTDGGGAPPPALRLRGPGVRTLHDGENATFHLVVDTRVARVRTMSGDPVPMANATVDAYLARVEITGGTPERLDGRFFLREAGGRLEVVGTGTGPGPDGPLVTVIGNDAAFLARGDVNLAPGSTVTLRALTPNGTVLASHRVRVGTDDRDPDESSFEQVFDGVALDDGQGVDVELRYDGETVATSRVVAGRPPTLTNATVERVPGTETGTETGTGGPTVRFGVTARYPAPGFVVVQSRDGYVGYPVPAGERVRVNGTVVRPQDEGTQSVRLIGVYDADRDGSLDAPGDGGPADPAFAVTNGNLLVVRPELPPPSPTPTVTAPEPGTTLPSTGNGPGPGLAGSAAAVGLAVLALVARRC